MHKFIVSTHYVLLLVFSCLLAVTAFADGESPSAAVEAGVAHAPGSIDKRMPPVIPGQAVSDGRKEMNVWSTSGPVAVSEAPEPFAPKRAKSAQVQDLPSQIIVDGRKPISQPGAVQNSQ